MMTLGAEADGGGDADALLHAAAELVRKEAGDFGLEVDGFEQLGDADLELVLGWILLMGLDGIFDLAADARHRIERVHRALGDECDLGQTAAAHLVFGEGEEVDAIEQDLAADDLAGRLDQAHDREGNGGLAGAGLADQAESLSGLQRKADAVHGLDWAAGGGEMDFKFSNIERRSHTTPSIAIAAGTASLRGQPGRWCKQPKEPGQRRKDMTWIESMAVDGNVSIALVVRRCSSAIWQGCVSGRSG